MYPWLNLLNVVVIRTCRQRKKMKETLRWMLQPLANVPLVDPGSACFNVDIGVPQESHRRQQGAHISALGKLMDGFVNQILIFKYS